MSDLALYQQIAERLVRAGYDPTKAGDAVNWLIKALHPAWGGTCNTIPDHALTPSVCPDYIVSQTVGTPNPGATSDWDCMVIRPPGDVTGAIIVRGPPGCDFANANAVPGVPTLTDQCNVSYLRTQPLESVELLTNFTPYGALNDPPTLPIASKAVTFLPVLRPAGSRIRYAGLTVYPVSSDLYNQGTIFAGQFARPAKVGYGQAQRGLPYDVMPGTDVTDWTVFQRVVTDIPLDEASMQLLDPSAVAWPYKNGAYLPTRFLDPTIDFLQPALSHPAMFCYDSTDPPPTTARTGVGCFSLQQHIATQWAALPTNAGRPPPWMYNLNLGPGGVTAYECFDSNVFPTSVPIVILRGLASQASITVRVYIGLEYLPSILSPALAFTKAASPPAPSIVDLYHSIVHDMNRSCWPSSYNSLGTILGAILGVAKKVLPIVATVSGLIPHPVAKMVSAGAGALGGAAAAAHAAYERSEAGARASAPVLAVPLSGGGGSSARLLLPAPVTLSRRKPAQKVRRVQTKQTARRARARRR